MLADIMKFIAVFKPQGRPLTARGAYLAVQPDCIGGRHD